MEKSDLQAISDLLDSKLQPIHERLDRVEGRLDKVDGRLDRVEGRLDRMEEDIAAIKEDAEITRSAANKLIEWAEVTHDRVGKPVPDFPILKRAEG